jgi:hypothetical protein
VKHLKMLTLVIVSAVALLASASASATQLTSPNGTVYTGTFQAQSTGALDWHGSFSTIKCNKSALEGSVASHGSTATTKITLSSLSFSECNFVFKVLKPGSVEIHTANSTLNDGNGTITSNGMELTIETSIASCLFTTKFEGTDVGVITGSDTGKARWDINSAAIPRTGHSIFCGSSAILTGSYEITTPSTLTVD